MADFFASAVGQVVIQAIGICGMTLGILCFQAKKKTTIFLLQMAASLLWATHFFLLDSLAGAVSNLVVVARNLCYANKDKIPAFRKKWLPVLFAAAAVGVGVWSFTLEGWISILPNLSMFGMALVYHGGSEKNIRLYSYVNSPCWLIYNAVNASWAGVLCESFTLVSVTVALFRFRQKKREKPV